VSTPAGERRKPGSFNRSKMLAALKRQARAAKKGVKPETARVWESRTIMAYAGKPGMLSVRRSRLLCGYRHASPSKEWPSA